MDALTNSLQVLVKDYTDAFEPSGWEAVKCFAVRTKVAVFNCTVRVFRQKFTLEDAIGSHACSLEASRRVTIGIPLGSPLFLPVHTVNCVQTLKGMISTKGTGVRSGVCTVLSLCGNPIVAARGVLYGSPAVRLNHALTTSSAAHLPHATAGH
jgi:hypothetical protein